jgi:hypothetical protein
MQPYELTFDIGRQWTQTIQASGAGPAIFLAKLEFLNNLASGETGSCAVSDQGAPLGRWDYDRDQSQDAIWRPHAG